MADDFIEEALREGQLRFGRSLTPAELGQEFARHGFEARVQHLKTLKESPKDDGALSFNDATKKLQEKRSRLQYERTLQQIHEKLRKVNR
jgi:hypothetical protein